MSGADASATNIAAHTSDTPQLLLDHHLKELPLPLRFQSALILDGVLANYN